MLLKAVRAVPVCKCGSDGACEASSAAAGQRKGVLPLVFCKALITALPDERTQQHGAMMSTKAATQTTVLLTRSSCVVMSVW